jgi:hypothetical protein
MALYLGKEMVFQNEINTQVSVANPGNDEHVYKRNVCNVGSRKLCRLPRLRASTDTRILAYMARY